MRKILKTSRLLIACVAFPGLLGAQQVLDNYIQEGFRNNQVLQQKNITLEKAVLALQIAKSNFLPSVNFSGTYTTAQGGRYSELPVGDMLNPVYATLNQLTGSGNFPQIENQQIDFLPKNYYDVYVRTSMPLFNTDVIYNKRIESQKIQLEEFQVQIYKRELVRNIKTAYYNYLSASEAVKVYENAIGLVEKNVALNQSLMENGKGLNASLMRSQSELENVRAQLNDVMNQADNARNYFNFLLNRPMNTPIEVEQTTDIEVLLKSQGLLGAKDSSRREELDMIRQAEEIQATVISMNKKYWVPKVNAFLDLGSQAVDMEFSDKSRYYMVGLNVGIPIFNGFRNNYKIRQSSLDLKATQLNYQHVDQQLQLSVNVARNNLATAIRNYAASQERQKTAESYFNMIDRGYKEGVNSQIEFIDANNQLTASSLQVKINEFKILTALAELERETAGYELGIGN